MRRQKKPTLRAMVLLFIVGSLICWGCEKQPRLPGVDPIQPKVELAVSPPGILPYGAVCTVTWESTDASSVFLNNKKVGTTGSIADKLFKDTLYVIIASNEHLSARKEKEVRVGDWTSSKLGLLTRGPWRKTSNKFYRDGVLLISFILTEYEKKDIYIYSVEGKYSVFNSGIQVGGMEWGFSPDEKSLYHGPGLNDPRSEVLTISKLNEQEIVLTKVVPFLDGLPCLGEAIFERI